MATETTTYTLDQFFADTRATIKAKGVPSGLAEVRDHLEKLLRNPELLKKHLGDPVPYKERTTIGHDPETDVHVLVHGREKASNSSIHDHGPCWVSTATTRTPRACAAGAGWTTAASRATPRSAAEGIPERAGPGRRLRRRRHPLDRVRRRHVLHPGDRRRRRDQEDAEVRRGEEDGRGRQPGDGSALRRC